MERKILSRYKCLLCKTEKRPLFKFPRETNRLVIWLKRIGKEHLLQNFSTSYIQYNARLCAAHFDDSYFTSTLKLRLSRFAVPYAPKKKDQESSIESLNSNSENPLSLAELNCEFSEKTSLSKTGKNLATCSSSQSVAALWNKVSEKSSFIAVIPSSQSAATSLIQVSKKNVVHSVSSSSKINSLNETSDKAFKIDKTVTDHSTADVTNNLSGTAVTLCCPNRKEAVSFYKLLQDPKQRMRWISSTETKKGKPSQIMVLCPQHYNEDSNTNFPSALKENTVPNFFALNNQKDVELFQKLKDVPTTNKKKPIDKKISELLDNPNEIKEVFVKVKWDEPENKITKKIYSSSREVVTDDGGDVRKKFKRGEECSSNDIISSNLPNTSSNLPKRLSQTARKSFTKYRNPRKNLRECAEDSSNDIISSNLTSPPIAFLHILKTPNVELSDNNNVKKNLKRNTECYSNKTVSKNFSNPPLQQTAKEKIINVAEVKQTVQSDTVCSSSDMNSTNQDLSTNLAQTTKIKLISTADTTKNLQKDLPLATKLINLKNSLACMSQKSLEEPAFNDVGAEENLSNNTACSSTDINSNNNSIHLPQKLVKQIVKQMRKERKKHIVMHPLFSDKKRPLLHTLNSCLEKDVKTKSQSYSENSDQIDPVNSPRKNTQFLNDSSIYIAPAEKINCNNSYNEVMKKTTCMLKPHSDNVIERKNLTDSRTQTTSVEEKRQSVACSTSAPLTHTNNVTEKNNLIDFSSQITISTGKKDLIDSFSQTSTEKKDLIDSSSQTTSTKKRDLIDASSQTTSTESTYQNGSCNVSEKTTVRVNSYSYNVADGNYLPGPSILIVPKEEIIENDFSSLEEAIEPNISYSDVDMKEKIHNANFPKIVHVEGGIDSVKCQGSAEITELKRDNCNEIIKLPNDWWGITRTPKYIICTKWNESYDPIFRVIIEKDFSVKIFVKGRCFKNSNKVSLESIPILLEEVDSYQICAGIDDKSMTDCMGCLKISRDKPFTIWCKGCQRKGEERIIRQQLLQELQ